MNTATDTKPAYIAEAEYVKAAVSVIGNIMKDEGMPLAELLAAFPNRPTTRDECTAIASWVGVRIKERRAATAVKPTSPAPTSQGVPNWDDITDGNYALPYNGKTHFYRVSRREGRGKWAGRTFVNVQERASDELYRVEFKRGLAIMHSIREYGVEKAHLLFSTELGQCWHCLKSLTDDTNPYKVHGLGPVCGPKVMG